MACLSIPGEQGFEAIANPQMNAARLFSAAQVRDVRPAASVPLTDTLADLARPDTRFTTDPLSA
jgi:hypothetical protein